METAHSTCLTINVSPEPDDQPSVFKTEVQTYGDGSIEFCFAIRPLPKTVGIEEEEWDTGLLPREFGIRLRNFLNYAYPREDR